MSYPASGGIPQIFSVTVSAGTPYVMQFAGTTNYIKVTSSGGGTLAFTNKGSGLKLAAPTGGASVSWEGPAKTNGIILNSSSGNVTVEIVAFLVG